MAIKCPKCQSDNTDSARFCSNCATQLMPGGQTPAVLTKTLESPTSILTKGSLVAGKYRILEEIGRGGMGIVYEAEDTKLSRKVAVKVLPEVFTADPERLARFGHPTASRSPFFRVAAKRKASTGRRPMAPERKSCCAVCAGR